MRKAEKVAPSLLLVRDDKGCVFGAYVTEAWRYAPRFYGTGETYVFQVGQLKKTSVHCISYAVASSRWQHMLSAGSFRMQLK